MLTEGIIISIITVFGGAIVKLLIDVAQARKDNSELKKMIDAQNKRSRKRDHIMYKLNSARDKRTLAYDEYDQAVKHLEIDHAQSYISNNDKDKLLAQLDVARKARLKYKQAHADYVSVLQDVNKELLELEEDDS